MMSKTRTDVEVTHNVVALHEDSGGEAAPDPIRSAAGPTLSTAVPRKGSRGLLFLVCVILGLPAAARMYEFAVRSAYRHQIMFNEGWNAYYAHSAASQALYGSRPERMAVNYPPLSFHLVGAFGRLTGDVNFAGRLLSLVSLVWVTLCAALIVKKISGDTLAPAFAALF